MSATSSADDKGKKSIIFNSTKRESHHPNSGFKKLFRRLRSNFKVATNKDEVSRDRLSEANLVVFGGSREPFSTSEFDELKGWLNSGGRALVLLGDGGEKQSGCNMNFLLEEYGMSVNNDSVLRSVFYKYLHPKEVFIGEGILVPDMARKKNSITLGSGRSKGTTKPQAAPKTRPGQSKSDTTEKFPFVYPYGATLNVQRPSRPLLSSGQVSYPMNRPVAAMWESDTVSEIGAQRGRIVVIGSVDIFGDDWLDKEENGKLCDLVFAWLLGEADFDMTSDRQDSELAAEFTPVPHIEALSANLKPCLQGMDDLPRDFTKLFDLGMFGFDTNFVPQVVRLYEIFGVPHEPLTLIPPQFECPLPKLTPATFPPAMREPPPPALDQFDLDEHFAKESLRLAQLTNKCTNGEEDLEYYIAEAGEILGVMQDLPFGEKTAKHILFHIFSRVVDFKKQDFEPSAAGPALVMAVPLDDDQSRDGPSPHKEGPVPATAVFAHVDLAPMRGEAGRQHLKALDPTLKIGGPALALGGGGAGAAGAERKPLGPLGSGSGSVKSEAKGVRTTGK